MAEERFSGVVQWFNNSRGFGFIKPDNGGEDLFVHQSAIRSEGYRCLIEGDSVEFAIANGDNEKTKAVDVTGPNGAPLQSKKDNYGWSSGGDKRNGGGACYQCGDFGHLARDCSLASNAGGGACFNCGEFGHLARDCTQGNGTGGGGSGSCFSCGENGHMARDCRNGINRGNGGGCFMCGEVGHLARDCGSNAAKSNCFNCGKPGHFARECVEASG